jgi:hypothetical protein
MGKIIEKKRLLRPMSESYQCQNGPENFVATNPFAKRPREVTPRKKIKIRYARGGKGDGDSLRGLTE